MTSRDGEWAGPADVDAFRQTREELERRSREWTRVVRLLEAHQNHLATLATERDGDFAQLAGVMSAVQDAALQLKAATDAIRAGESTADLADLFRRNEDALDELEHIAKRLKSELMPFRSAWEECVRSIDAAQRMLGSER